jgi:geranylgeranyl diphosphate synthase, type I
VHFEQLQERLRAVPQVAAWPQMLELIDRAVPRGQPAVWDLPVAACAAVGGSSEAALQGAAAVFCSLLSIHLVDDLLDEDPDGDFRRLGAGPAANLALAFQAAAHSLLDVPAIAPGVRAELHACLARMSMATAFGQHLDSREAADEEEYWRVVGAKTPPLFGAALRLGAMLGGAPAATAEELDRLGQVLGKFAQVSDDLADALSKPASADWRRRGNNLAMLYAMVADHPAREDFLALSSACHDPEALAAAQQLLVASGGVSYCAWKMTELSREADLILAGIQLHDLAPLARLLAAHRRPLERLLCAAGAASPLEAAGANGAAGPVGPDGAADPAGATAPVELPTSPAAGQV